MENLLLKERLTPRGYEGLIGVINPNDAMERCDKMSLLSRLVYKAIR